MKGLSYIIVKHGMIELLARGYKFESNAAIFPTLVDVVQSLNDILRYPVEVSIVDYKATARRKTLLVNLQIF